MGERFSRKFLHGFPTLKLSVLNVFHCPSPSAIDIGIVRAPAANIPQGTSLVSFNHDHM